MSILTKEVIQKILNDDWLLMDDCEGLENCTVIKELARMALAAMESEADCKERKLFCSTDTARMRKVISVSAGIEGAPLYRHAQPAPVVPKEWTIADAVKFCKETGRQDAGSAMDAWNACRAAMLAAAPQSPGSEPATVPGKWIPVSERMPIEFEAVIAFDGDQVYGEAMYSSDDGFTIDGYEPCDRLNLQNVTHWMPLPAGPQEVKGE